MDEELTLTEVLETGKANEGFVGYMGWEAAKNSLLQLVWMTGGCGGKHVIANETNARGWRRVKAKRKPVVETLTCPNCRSILSVQDVTPPLPDHIALARDD